jgi:hypothetical protein
MKDYSTFKCHNIGILSTEAKKERTQMIPVKGNEQFMYLSASRRASFCIMEKPNCIRLISKRLLKYT